MAGQKSGSTNSHSRSSAKAKQAAHQAYLDLYVTKDGPYKFPVPKPMDFDSLPLPVLRKYNYLHGLNTPSALSHNGSLLDSEIGRRTYSYKHKNRISKKELAGAVKNHVLSQPVRESEIIVDFLYAVHNQSK